MKKTIFFLLLVLIFFSCKTSTSKPDVLSLKSLPTEWEQLYGDVNDYYLSDNNTYLLTIKDTNQLVVSFKNVNNYGPVVYKLSNSHLVDNTLIIQAKYRDVSQDTDSQDATVKFYWFDKEKGIGYFSFYEGMYIPFITKEKAINYPRRSIEGMGANSDNNNENSELGEVFAINTNDFISSGWVPFDTIYGDLNKDGMEDCVLITKATLKEGFEEDDRFGKKMIDRNRRGLIIAFKRENGYELMLKNDGCFASENEDGGVYYAPELDVSITSEGTLKIYYYHGRYGSWGYIFRYQNSDFQLIGGSVNYDRGPVVLSEISVNFMTKKLSKSVNENQDNDDPENEKIVTTWYDISFDQLVSLKSISNFDSISIDSYYSILDNAE